MYDTGTEVDAMDEAAYSKVGGEVVSTEEELLETVSTEDTIRCIRKVLVRMKVRGAETNVLMRVIPGRAGMMLISERTGREIGIRIIGIPYLDEDLNVPTFDEEWAKGQKAGVEEQATPKEEDHTTHA
jgi:hypothetical protein